jgi:hypothetical protein
VLSDLPEGNFQKIQPSTGRPVIARAAAEGDKYVSSPKRIPPLTTVAVTLRPALRPWWCSVVPAGSFPEAISPKRFSVIKIESLSDPFPRGLTHEQPQAGGPRPVAGGVLGP